MDVSATSTASMARPGKSAQSTGHMAKAAVAAAQDAGAVLPKNAQGLAASSIARGIDPAALFEAMIPPPPPVEETPLDEVNTPQETDPVQAAEAGFGEAAIIASGVENGAATALNLLEDSVNITV